MLKIFYANENQDKNAFLFSEIDNLIGKKENVFLIVPEQYTLQTERDAIFYLKRAGFMDFNVISKNRLADKIMKTMGGRTRVHIDKIGRYMLLSRILRSEEKNLKTYGGLTKSTAFLEMINDIISEFKNHSASVDSISSAISKLDGDSILCQKLQDIRVIYSRYQDEIRGKYTDTEEFTDLFIEKLSNADFVKDSYFFVGGFDYMLPITRRMVERLVRFSKGVFVVLSGDPEDSEKEYFKLTSNTGKNLSEESGVKFEYEKIKGHDFNYNPEVSVFRIANFYDEAKNAAEFIINCVKDGYRYKDIIIACNDLDERGKIYTRVFNEYNIPVFLDKERSLLQNPAMIYFFNLLDILNNGFNKNVISFLKSGLCNFTREEIEKLENYVTRYKVKSWQWEKPFKYGLSQEPEIEEIRKKFVEQILPVKTEYQNSKNATGKIKVVSDFLVQDNLKEKLKKFSENLDDIGNHEAAQEMKQVYVGIVDILDQAGELLKDQETDGEDLMNMLLKGAESMKVSIIPPTLDQILLSKIGRIQPSRIKILMIMGANDTVFPDETSGEKLLNQDELSALEEKDIIICKEHNSVRYGEELSIHRNLALTAEKLYFSYAASDNEGNELLPSRLIKGMKISPNLFSEEDFGDKLPEGKGELTEDVSDSLYMKGKYLTLSPSRLENFSRCPFMHFVRYGLRPYELDTFEIKERESGEIFHECLKRLAEELGETNMPLYDPESLWQKITRDEVDYRVERIIKEIAEEYNEGIGTSEKKEKYRISRIEKTIKLTAQEMVSQVKEARIEKIFLEEAFGYGEGLLPAIKIKTKDKEVSIEGKIDRIDVLPNNYIKIIDYKSGSERYSEAKVRASWSLQLFLYLRAALSLSETAKPAGVFYFRIADKKFDATGLKEERVGDYLRSERKKLYKLDGIVTDNPEVIRDIAGDFTGYSDILPIMKNKDGEYKSRDERILSEGQFSELAKNVNESIENLCKEMIKGDIGVKPKRIGNESACDFCKYNAICNVGNKSLTIL